MPRRFTSSLAVIGSLAVSLFLAGGAKADVKVDLYSGFTHSGSGAPFSGYLGSVSAPTIWFAINGAPSWRPLGLDSFGADIKGFVTVPNAGAYYFDLASQGGCQFFFDGELLIDNRDQKTAATGETSHRLLLEAGVPQPYELQYFSLGLPNEFGGENPLALEITNGTNMVYDMVPASWLTASHAPEPGSLALLATAALPLLGFLRRRKQTAG